MPSGASRLSGEDSAEFACEPSPKRMRADDDVVDVAVGGGDVAVADGGRVVGGAVAVRTCVVVAAGATPLTALGWMLTDSFMLASSNWVTRICQWALAIAVEPRDGPQYAVSARCAPQRRRTSEPLVVKAIATSATFWPSLATL